MNHDAAALLVNSADGIDDPVRIRKIFRGYLRQWKTASIFFGILGAFLASIPFFAIQLGSDKYLLWATGAFCLLMSYGLSWFKKTDPITHFVKSPADFSVCQAVISSAIDVPASSHQPATVRAFSDYDPGGGTITIETRFHLHGWNEAVCVPSPAWVIYKTSKPEFSFLAGIQEARST